tara:strand:+ start:2277 stop:3386 length:1110 start_codon:yes stop_codon:yes gene_type:complete
MGASNLSQVFISNALTMLDGSLAQIQGAGAAPADDVGVLTLGPGTAEFKQTKLYESTIDASTDDIAITVNPTWLYHSFQLVQRAVTGNNIVSPIIDVNQVKRIDYSAHIDTAMEKTVIDIADGTITNDEIEVKVVVRAAPTNYADFAQPGNAINDLSGEGKVCPIGIHNNTHHKVFNVTSMPADRLATAAGADNELGLYDDLKAKIDAHGVLKDLLKVTDQGTSGIDFETRFAHVTVEFIYNNITNEETVITEEAGFVTKTAFVAGVGNDWQVFSDELRCRSKYGNFNRMYFPQAFDTYVTNGSLYDKIVISYETPNWPKGAGIVPAGGMNQAVIYYTNEGADPGTTGTNEFDDVFGYAANTDKTFIWT